MRDTSTRRHHAIEKRVYMPLFIVVYRPSGVPADLKSAVKKVRPIKTGGFVIPQQKGKHSPLLRIANPQSLNRLGHFLTPDSKSGGTPNGITELFVVSGIPKDGPTRSERAEAPSPGQRPGYTASSHAPCKGKSFTTSI